MEMTNVLAFPSFILLLLIGAVAGQDDTTEGSCEPRPCKCPRNYRPMCGTDGKTYSNNCMLNCDTQCNDNLQVAYEGPCQKKSAKSSSSECPRFACRCMNLDEPVCGSNGKTYANKCMLHCDRQCNEHPQVAHEGPCQEESATNSPDKIEEEECQPKPCKCTREYQPVCGSNGKTYANDCLLKCDRQCNQNPQVVHEGPCQEKLAKTPKSNTDDRECKPEPCKCTKEYHAVCGTDQRSYSNPCLLECNRDQCNPNLKTAHEGRCVKQSGRNSTGKAKNKKKRRCKPKPCMCTREYSPVCGSDHRTYNNPCLLKCNRNQCNKKLRSAYRGRCEKKSKKRRNKGKKKKKKQRANCKQRSCTCTREYRPICGTDQKTYGNKCLFRCEQRCKSGLKQAHQGPCETETTETSTNNGTCNPDGCVCTEEYAPVCGSNNRTYANRCQLSCDQNCNQGLQEAHPGRCESETTEKSTKNGSCNPDGCICTQQYDPVCGSNKRTYSNRCELRCDQNCNRDLREEHDGVCKTSKSFPRKSCSRDCSCDDEDYDPVCGTNRKTYSSLCRLECDQRCNRRIKKAYDGKCKRQSKKRTTKKPAGCKQRCVCTHHRWPVCGSNGKTYSNDCALKCDQRCNKSLRMVSHGSCGKPRRTTRKRPKSKPRTRRTTTTTETSDDFE